MAGRCWLVLDNLRTVALLYPELQKPAFQRAFVLDPIWPPLHSSTRSCRWILAWLMRRCVGLATLKHHPTEAESFSSLVASAPIPGLLRESVAAHRRAVELDPAVTTSVAHTSS